MAALVPTMSDVKPFDLDQVRADFPILQTLAHGKPLVYLDNAATSQKPQAERPVLTTQTDTKDL